MLEDTKEQVRQMIEAPLRQQGCEVVDLLLSQYKNKHTLRVFIFSDRGTTIDECARISQLVGDLIDGTDLFPAGYTLEVSSPGLDRPLTSPLDFKYRIGERVAIDFVDPKREKLEAEILSAGDAEITVRNQTGQFTLCLAEIDKAMVVF